MSNFRPLDRETIRLAAQQMARAGIDFYYGGGYRMNSDQVVVCCFEPALVEAWADACHRAANFGEEEPLFPDAPRLAVFEADRSQPPGPAGEPPKKKGGGR